MGRRTLLLLASLLLAAMGTVLVFLYVRSADARATDGQEPVQVLVASKQINAGTTGQQATASQSIELKSIPRSAIVPGALGNLNVISELAATTTIYPGQQIIAANFARDAAAATVPIAKGHLAVSVQLSDPARVSSLLGVNAHVTVFATVADVGGKSRTDVLLPNVRVLGIGSENALTQRTGKAAGGASTPATIVTLELTPQEAKKVVFASANGELYFGLLGAGDQPGQNGTAVDGSTVFGAGS